MNVILNKREREALTDLLNHGIGDNEPLILDDGSVFSGNEMEKIKDKLKVKL